jgi:hypothetical protein
VTSVTSVTSAAGPRGPYCAPDAPAAAWERLVGALEKKSLTLAGMYAHARLLAWDDQAIELAVPEKSVAADPEHVANLKKAVGDLVGAPLDVRVKAVAAGAAPPAAAAPSVAELESSRRQADRAGREEEARRHPATQAVIETFGAAIKEIKVDG